MHKILLVFSITILLAVSFLTILPSVDAVSFDSSEYGISSLAVYDGKLYAGGRGEGKIFVYDGNNWNLSYDDLNSSTTIFSLVVYDGKLYAGSSSLYVYDGNTWNITTYTYDTIYSLGVYDNKLYIGNYYEGDIFTYDGNYWNLSYTLSLGNVAELIEYDNKLYAGSSDSGKIFVYDGNNWNLSYDGSDAFIISSAIYNGKLYMGGRNDHNIYVYDGNNWNITNNTPNPYSLGVYDGKLYVGSGADVYVYDGDNWNITCNLGYFLCILEYNGKLYAGNDNGGLIYEFDGTTWNENLNSPDKPTLINPIFNYVNEDFNTTWLPSNWEEIVHSGEGHWNLSTYSLGLPFEFPSAHANSLIYRTVIFNVSLFTPKITIPSIFYSVILDCDIYFRQYSSDEGYIRVWSENKTILEETLEHFDTDILQYHITEYLDFINYSSLTDIQIEFYYTTNNNVYQDFFIIDNVKISNVYPSNISINTNLSVNVIDRDEENNIMSVSFYWDDDTLIQTITNVSSYTNAKTSNLSLDYNTIYNWYTIASDGERQTQSDIFSFTTIEETPLPPLKPSANLIFISEIFIFLGLIIISYFLITKRKKKI